jgi:hypothetical protein
VPCAQNGGLPNGLIRAECSIRLLPGREDFNMLTTLKSTHMELTALLLAVAFEGAILMAVFLDSLRQDTDTKEKLQKKV